MKRLNIAEELSVGTKTAAIAKAIAGRLWGEDSDTARLLHWDLEHGVTDAEVLDADEDYAVVRVTNHRERENQNHWLVGRSADREDRIFIHPYRSGVGNVPTVVNLLEIVERRDMGFSRRIQGDVMMAVGVFDIQQRGYGEPDMTLVIGNHRYRLGVWDGMTRPMRKTKNGEPMRDEDGREKYTVPEYPLKGATWGRHRVTCPAGVWATGLNGVPALVCMGSFDISHVEHGGTTIDVPKGFVGILALQDDGIAHSLQALLGGTTPAVPFD